MSSLAHHGVKGQKWGVRRYQNPNGTRTALGKKQLKAIRLSRNEEGIRQVYRSLSDRDLNLLGYEKEEIEENRKDDFKDLGRRHTDYDQYNRVRYKNGDAVGYIAATGYQTTVGRGKKIVNILAVDLAVNSNYRGQGHSVELGKDIVRWFDRYGSKEYDRMEWYAKAENIASQKAAERSGFERRSKKEATQGWVKYSYKRNKVKHSSIGGNMNYIYGNTLVLGDSSYLAHHGILGQKWGIRRFQNKDGSRTAEGKKRYRSRRTVFEDYQNAQLDNVISNNKYNYKRHPIKYNPIKRSILKKKADDLRTEYDDVLKNGRTNSGLFQKPRKGSISLTANEKKETLDAVRKADIEIRNPKYRFHDKVSVLAAATEKSTISACKKLAWYDAKRMDNEERRFVISEDLEDMYASFKKKNPGSQKEQFEKFNKIPEVKKLIDESDRLFNENEQLSKEQASECHKVAATVFDTTEWAKPFGEQRNGYNDTYLSVLERAINVNSVMYASREAKKIEHSSIGGNMNYIYGNTLVLGDSSYLEHHGIKNQKWGVRRFQNPDGSLTAAGRIRYGVTGAAKAAFKVGKKLGAATASAARAGVKKAKDNAYAKKKEKASQTREGVLKNKKMFTADELKALETRFKIEDEMSEASLRHGQAVARTVSQYANTTRDVLSALQTGGNAVSAITKAFADIQSYKNAKGVAEAAKEKGMTTKEFDLFLKEKYPNAKKDDGSKKKDKNSNKAKDSDSDNNDNDNPPNNGGGGGAGSKKQAEYAANRQKAQEAIYAKRKADLDSRESGAKLREDYLNKRQDALVKVSKQRQSEQDERDADLNRRDKAASEREEKLKSAAKTAADVMSKLNKKQADLDKKEEFLNSVESYRLDTLSEFKKNEEEAARRKKKNAKHSAIGEEMYADYLSGIYDPDYLEHFGVRGMKWGVRRYQNPDGTLTEKGKKRYANPDGSLNAKGRKIDAKRITKQLNANDKASAWAVRRRDDSREMAERNETRAEKARSKGKLERAEKFDTLAKKQRDEQKIQNKKYLDLEEKNGKLVAEAIAKDYDVRQIPMMRDVTNGKEHVANITLGLAAAMAGLPFTYKTGVEVPGTYYMVKAKKASKNGQVVLSPAGMAVAAASQKKAKHDAFQIQNGVLMYGFTPSDELEHFGLKGMKWGVRRFQNKDGSLTEAGKQRYANTGNLDSGGGGGGGVPEEEDEETKKAIEEAAKKAGMTVDEYRKKFADKVAEIKKKTSDTTNAVGKFLNDIGSDKVDKSFSKQSYEASNRNAKKAEDYKRKAASAANAGDKDKAADYNKQAARLERASKQQGEQGKKWGDLYSESTVKGRAKSAANAVKTAAKKASEAASDAKYEVGYHAENALDAVTGQRSKRQAKAWTETARYHEKRAEQAKNKYISGTRNPDSFEGQLRNSNNAVAARNQKRAKEAQETANAWTNSYKRSLAGRAEAASKKIGAKAESFGAARDAKLANHLVRNAATAKRAQSATLSENRNRNAAHLAERRREKAINDAKAKIRSGELPVNELTRYAKSSVGQLKSAAKAELARREREQALTSMGSDYARATARVTTTSSTTNTADARNEKLARDRRDKRKQAAKASATAKKNRLAGSGSKKYTSGQTGGIGIVGSGRGKTSTRR